MVTHWHFFLIINRSQQNQLNHVQLVFSSEHLEVFFRGFISCTLKSANHLVNPGGNITRDSSGFIKTFRRIETQSFFA